MVLVGIASSGLTAAAILGIHWGMGTGMDGMDGMDGGVGSLPAFPSVTVIESSGRASDGVLTVALEGSENARSAYVAAIDNRGMVLWSSPNDTGLARTFRRLPDGRFLVNQYAGHRYPPLYGFARLLDADFRQIAVVAPRPPVNGGYGHDIQLTRDGNFLVTANSPVHEPSRPGGTITNPLIQELTPAGDVVWHWDGYEHRDAMAWSTDCATEIPDWAHINSLHLTENGDVLASFRNCHQILKLDRSGGTGQVEWKIGGSEPEPGGGIQYFRVEGDPAGTFCGQHAASLTEEGHLLLFDNGVYVTSLTRNPENPGRHCPRRRTVAGTANSSRAVEYVLD